MNDEQLEDEAAMKSVAAIRSVDEPTPERSGRPRAGAGVGSALGAAMLGLEQAFRRTPPAEVVVHEHRPMRGASGEGGEITLEFPDPIEPLRWLRRGH